jgi:hypothetical protein
MSWSFTIAARDSQIQAAIASRFAQERSYTHHSPASRRTLRAIEQFVDGAAMNTAKGTAVRVDTSGHIDDNGYGSVTVNVSLGPPAEPDAPPAGAPDTRQFDASERPEPLNESEAFAEGVPPGVIPDSAEPPASTVPDGPDSA